MDFEYKKNCLWRIPPPNVPPNIKPTPTHQSKHTTLIYTDGESLCGWRAVLWPCAVHCCPAGRRGIQEYSQSLLICSHQKIRRTQQRVKASLFRRQSVHAAATHHDIRGQACRCVSPLHLPRAPAAGHALVCLLTPTHAPAVWTFLLLPSCPESTLLRYLPTHRCWHQRRGLPVQQPAYYRRRSPAFVCPAGVSIPGT